MKAPSADYVIRHRHAFRPLADAAAQGVHPDTPWAVVERATGRVVWKGKTFLGARTAHYRFAIAKITASP